VSMTDVEKIDEYVAASGDPEMTETDINLLARYASLNSDGQCRQGCDHCADSCPAGVPIAEVLRTRMYDVDYGDRDLALADYGRLSTGAGACLTCTAQPCRTACPYGLPIPNMTRDAATRLG